MFDALAAETCPSGYVAIPETDVYVSLSDSCPSGHTMVQTKTSVENCISALASGAKTCTYFADKCQTGKYFNGTEHLPCDTGMYCPGVGTVNAGEIGCYDMCPDGYENSDIKHVNYRKMQSVCQVKIIMVQGLIHVLYQNVKLVTILKMGYV